MIEVIASMGRINELGLAETVQILLAYAELVDFLFDLLRRFQSLEYG